MFGINGKLYRFSIEVEPPHISTKDPTQANPPSDAQTSMDTEKGGNTSADENGSQKSSIASSDNGSITRSVLRSNPRNTTYSHTYQDVMEPPTLPSLLKGQIPSSLRQVKDRSLDFLLNNAQEAKDGFELLRRMELLEDEELNTDGEMDETQEEQDG